MSKFAWGKVIDRLVLDFDGSTFEVTKYHPDKFFNGHHQRGQYEDSIAFHSEELHASDTNLYALVVAVIAYRHLGNNQRALVSGLVRALGIGEKESK